MVKVASSIEELTSALIRECSRKKALDGVSEGKIRKIIKTLVSHQFSEDGRRNARNSLNKTITEVVDDIFTEAKG